MADANGNAPSPFSRPRALGGFILLMVGCALMLIDALNSQYQVDIAQLGLTFGMGAILLGVEGLRKLVG